MDENIPMQVAIYGRSATWQPGEDPVAEQMAQCKAFALEHRMRIVAVFEDHGASGSHGDRPGLHALTAAMGRRQIDAVVVRDLDRLSRDWSGLVQIFEVAREASVEIITVADGAARRHGLEKGGHQERPNRNRKVHDDPIQGPVPYGYRSAFSRDRRTGYREICQEEAGIIRHILDTYLSHD